MLKTQIDWLGYSRQSYLAYKMPNHLMHDIIEYYVILEFIPQLDMWYNLKEMMYDIPINY